jgi:hypothetical protein
LTWLLPLFGSHPHAILNSEHGFDVDDSLRFILAFIISAKDVPKWLKSGAIAIAI